MVVIVKGRISTDPTIWEFHIKNKILPVETDKLENPKSFRQQYLKAFNRPAPKISSKRWIDFITALAEEKAIETEAPEESEHVFIAYQIFEKVTQFEISDDPEDALSGNYLYKAQLEDGKIYFCMPSDKFLGLVEGSGFRIAPQKLSGTMSELGMKREGTPRIRYLGYQKRSWCFVPEAVLSHQRRDGN